MKELEQEDDNGDTAFLLAVLHGHVTAARALHAAGANAAATRVDGSSALHIAAASSASSASSSSAAASASASVPSPTLVSTGNLIMFTTLIESGANTLLGTKNANGDNVYVVPFSQCIIVTLCQDTTLSHAARTSSCCFWLPVPRQTPSTSLLPMHSEGHR